MQPGFPSSIHKLTLDPSDTFISIKLNDPTVYDQGPATTVFLKVCAGSALF